MLIKLKPSELRECRGGDTNGGIIGENAKSLAADGGITCIELLVHIAIIGILNGLLLNSVDAIRQHCGGE